jgi:hypothetical protein
MGITKTTNHQFNLNPFQNPVSHRKKNWERERERERERESDEKGRGKFVRERQIPQISSSNRLLQRGRDVRELQIPVSHRKKIWERERERQTMTRKGETNCEREEFEERGRDVRWENRSHSLTASNSKVEKVGFHFFLGLQRRRLLNKSLN